MASRKARTQAEIEQRSLITTASTVITNEEGKVVFNGSKRVKAKDIQGSEASEE